VYKYYYLLLTYLLTYFFTYLFESNEDVRLTTIKVYSSVLLSLCLDIVDFVVVLFLYLVKLLSFSTTLLATMLIVNKDEYKNGILWSIQLHTAASFYFQ